MHQSIEYYLTLGTDAIWTADQIVAFTAAFHEEAYARGIDDSIRRARTSAITKALYDAAPLKNQVTAIAATVARLTSRMRAALNAAGPKGSLDDPALLDELAAALTGIHDIRIRVRAITENSR